MFSNRKKWIALLGLVAFLGATAGVMAEDQAATSTLPAALTSMGVTATDVVSTTEAHQVRGQGGVNHGNVDWLDCYWGKGKPGGVPPRPPKPGCFPPPPPPPCNDNGGSGGNNGGNGSNGGHNGGNGGNGYTLTQTKDFTITDGVAKGTVNMMEGVIGTMKVTQVSGNQILEVDATFGGLAGAISLTDQGLQFQFGGKAFQESFDFIGNFNQNFSQSYTYGH